MNPLAYYTGIALGVGLIVFAAVAGFKALQRVDRWHDEQRDAYDDTVSGETHGG